MLGLGENLVVLGGSKSVVSSCSETMQRMFLKSNCGNYKRVNKYGNTSSRISSRCRDLFYFDSYIRSVFTKPPRQWINSVVLHFLSEIWTREFAVKTAVFARGLPRNRGSQYCGFLGPLAMTYHFSQRVS